MFQPKFKKDRYNRISFYKTEVKSCVNKFVINSVFFDSEIRIRARYTLFKFSDRFLLGHNYTNRCVFTGHPKVPFREFRVSRMEFRRLAKTGFLKGLQKSSWL